MQMQEYHPAPEARERDGIAPPTAMTATWATPTAPPSSPGVPNEPPATPAPVHPSGPPRGPQVGLTRVVLPIIAVAIGLLGMIDLAGADVSASAYVALPLTIVGLGLIAAAWYGRGWTLAVLGALLALALVTVTAGERASTQAHGSTWRPLTVDQIDPSYDARIGDSVVDLSAVDFTGQSKDVRASLDAGNLTVVVPSMVDVQAEVRVDVGNAVVFGQRWGGIGQSQHTVSDLGSDGPGGGTLVLHATVDVGNVEVRRS